MGCAKMSQAWMLRWLAIVLIGIQSTQQTGMMVTVPGSMQTAMELVVNSATGASVAHNGQVCSTWGNFHFHTFDGDFFQLPYTCNYILATMCDSTQSEFNIQLKRQFVNELPTISSFTIKLEGTVITLLNGNLTVNEQVLIIPGYYNGVRIERSTSYIKISSKLGVTVFWDEENSFSIELSTKYRNQTCGLCGDFNGIQQNEFTKNGEQLSLLDFGEKWKMDAPTEMCQQMEQQNHDCKNETSICEELLANEAFDSCRNLLSTSVFVDACVKDLCQCNSSDPMCLCDTISEFSRQCAHAGGRPQNWRTKEFCGIQCELNKVHSECGSPCPDTCSNQEGSMLCADHCVDGCVCPEGTVFNDIEQTGCVPVDNCPCIHNGKTYQAGEFYTRTCQECVCSKGRWNCTNLDCPGTCSLLGGSHITTFDGKAYRFNGNCDYVLSKDTSGNLAVLGHLAQCGQTETETCLTSVKLRMSTRTVTITSSGSVLINEDVTKLPVFSEQVTVFSPSTFFIIAHTSSLQIVIQLVPVMQVYLEASPEQKGKLRGLCGNFNDILADDFKAESGLIEGTAATFAFTWKTMTNCPDVSNNNQDPCSMSVEKERYAKEWCTKLVDPTGLFSQCHFEINPNSYKERCIYDACNCANSEECMCGAVSSYVFACASKGVMLDDWRDVMCGKFSNDCSGNREYSYNRSSCEQTCRSLSGYDHTCQVTYTTVDGCGCTEGTYLNDMDECVPSYSCPCYVDGEIIQPTQIISKDGTTCTCRDGNLHCIGHQQEITCTAPMVFLNCSNAGSGESGAECQKSCQNMDSNQCVSTQCKSGCVCPNGLFDDGKGGCVTEELCPCAHNGKFYQPGETLTSDCNNCTCRNRKFSCTTELCHRTCSIYGDSHYISFDGKRYSFNGNCEYTLSQDYCSNSPDGSFRIITENIPCGTTGTTCSKSIKIFLENTELLLSEEKIKVVHLDNGTEIPYKIHSVGIYLVIEAKNDLVVLWDKKTSLMVRLGPSFMGKVCGLCGNYDGNSNNDFMTRGGEEVVEPFEFGNSWSISTTCPKASSVLSSCDMRPHRQAWAIKQCSIIMSDVFSSCHSLVESIPYYDACVQDTCACDTGGDCECFCTAVAAYASACTKKGACILWRSPDVCPLFCDYYNSPEGCEWHYKPCGESCLKTCQNPSGVCFSQLPPLEGCYPQCPSDRPFFEETTMKCVPKEQCGCDVDGIYYNVGDTIPSNEKCTSCNCTSQGFSCHYDITDPHCTTNGCVFNNKTYPVGSMIYSTTDGNKTCITAECQVNGTTVIIERKMFPCTVTTTPLPHPPSSTAPTTPTTPLTTIFDFSTTVTQQLKTTPEITSTTETKTSPVTKHVPPTTTKEITSSSSPITTAPTDCKTICHWSQWVNSNYPSYTPTGQEVESIASSWKSGIISCQKPEEIECRATEYKDISLSNLGQNVTCDVSVGLICNNVDQSHRQCFNYEIRVKCCGQTCTTTVPPTTTKETASITTTAVPVPPTTTEETVFTTTTTTVPPTTTEETASITTTTIPVPPTTTKETISTTTTTVPPTTTKETAHITTTVTVPPTTTKETVSTTTTTTVPPTTTEETASITTTTVPVPPTTTKETISTTTVPPTTTKETISTTTTTTAPTTSSTPSDCKEVCHWSEWVNSNYPSYTPTGQEVESIASSWKSGIISCQKPEEIECRATEYKDISLSNLGQNVTCDVSVGLICNNVDQSDRQCFNYEIRVKCCGQTCTTTVPPTTTKETATTTKETVSTTTTTTVPPTTTKETASVTTTAAPVPPTTTKETISTTTTTTVPPTTTEETASITTTTVPVPPSTTKETISTTTIPPTTTKETTSTRTTTTVPTTTPITISTTTTAPTTSSTPSDCRKVCHWSEWVNSNYPSYIPTGQEVESIASSWKLGIISCQKPEEIECRATEYKDISLSNLGQNVTCDVSVGLICNNVDQSDRQCFNYEIRVKCCGQTCTTTVPPTTTKETASITTTTTTVPPTTTKETASITTTAAPVPPTTTKETVSTTTTTTVPPTTTEETTSFTTTKIPVPPTTTEETISTTTVPPTTTKETASITTTAAPVPPTTTEETVSTTTTTTVPPTTTEETASITTNTVPVPPTTTKETISTTTVPPSTTKETASITTTAVPVPPTTTEETVFTTTTTTVPPTTTKETASITTTTVPVPPTTTKETISTTTVPPTTTKETISTTTTTTAPTTSSTPSDCRKVCHWSEWVNSNYPSYTPTGQEVESIASSWKSGIISCQKPEEIECRATEYKDISLSNLGQNVTCDVSVGLICNNVDQSDRQCFNYEIRVKCCGQTCTTTLPPTTTKETASITTTAAPEPPTTTKETVSTTTTTTVPPTTTKGTASITTTAAPVPPTTTKETVSTTTTTTVPPTTTKETASITTTAAPVPPTTTKETVSTTTITTVPPTTTEETTSFTTTKIPVPSTTTEETISTTTVPPTTTKETASITTTAAPVLPTTTEETVSTTTTTTVPPTTTEETASITTNTVPVPPTTTKETISTITVPPSTTKETASITTTAVPVPPTTTEETVFTTTTTTVPPTTTKETASITTTTVPVPPTTTKETISTTTVPPTTTKETISTTTTTTAPTTSSTPSDCRKVCHWSEWVNSNYPSYTPTGQEVESIASSWKSGIISCQKPEEIECRATEYKDISLSNLGQNVTCDVSVGLICNNVDQSDRQCFNYEIRVKCCGQTCTTTVPPTTTRETASITTTAAPEPPTTTEETVFTTTTTTVPPTTTKETASITTTAAPVPPTTTKETVSTTTTTTVPPTTTKETASITTTAAPVPPTTTTETISTTTTTTVPPSTTKETASITTTAVPVPPTTTKETVSTTTTTTVPPTTTKETASITTTAAPVPPTTTTETISTTTTTTVPPSTTKETASITTTTVPVPPTTTKETISTTTVPPTTTKETISTTTTTTAPTTSSTPSDCRKVCHWSEWVNSNYPSYTPTGQEVESIASSWKSGIISCQKPEEIECRATEYKDISLSNLGQNVTCDVSVGLICNNVDQSDRQCFNYEIRVKCCGQTCTTTVPPTTTRETASITTTAAPEPPTTTKETVSTTTTTTVLPTTTKETASITTTAAPVPPTTTTETISTTTTTTVPPTTTEETISTTTVSPSTTKETASITTTAAPVPPTTTEETVSTTTTTTVPPTTTEETTSITTTAAPVPPTTTKETISTTTTTVPPTTTKETASITTTAVPVPPTTTEETVFTTTTTTVPPTTTKETTSITTTAAPVPPTTTKETISTKTVPPTITKETISTRTTTTVPTTTPTAISTTTTAPTTSSTPSDCRKVCHWSEWVNSNYPSYTPTGQEVESIASSWKSGIISCQKPEEIECRATDYKDISLSNLGQNVTCDVSVGLICNNVDQSDRQCFNYEIRVKCCGQTCTTTVPPTTTKETATTTKETVSTTTTTTVPPTTTEETASVTTTAAPVPPTTTEETVFTTTTTTVPPTTTKETASITTTAAPVPPTTTKETISTTTTTTVPPTTTEETASFTTTTVPVPPTTTKETISTTTVPPSTTKETASITTTAAPVPPTTTKETVSTTTTTTVPPTTTKETASITTTAAPVPPTTTKETVFTTTTTTVPPTTTKEIASITTTAAPVSPTTTKETVSTTTTTVPPTTTKETTLTTFHVNTHSVPTNTTPTKIPQIVITTTSSKTSSETTVSCVCTYRGQIFHPGSVMYNETDGAGWCFTAYCDAKCNVDKEAQPCPTTTIAPTTATSSTPPLIKPSSTTTPSTKTLPTTTSTKTLSTTTTTSVIPPKDCQYLDPPKKNGDTWTEKCYENTCIDGSINSKPVQCANAVPTKPVCVNGFPPEKVYDKTGCCYHYECLCKCNGWGDPHYVTFDGTYYTFQGNCTYVLVQEIIKKYNLSVHIKNYYCDTVHKLACPESLTIYYKSNKITLEQTRNPTINKVFVNDKQKIPTFSTEDFTITSTGIEMSVDIPAIKAKISFKGMNFAVNLPYSLFYNNTEGQCGKCDNNTANDCSLRNGEIESCEKTASNWTVNALPCAPPPPTTTVEKCEPAICEIIKSNVFEKCHEVLPPDNYFKACVYDECNMKNFSGCLSLENYARLCAEQSICVDWRSQTNGKCTYNCPAHKTYMPCGPKVERTCNSMYNDKYLQCDTQVCHDSFREGCFCPNGTTLFSTSADVCAKFCGCIGPDNEPKKPGDKWHKNCLQCECSEASMGEVCEPLLCPMAEPCNKPGYEIKIEDCCPNCVPKHVCVFNDEEYLPGAKIPTHICETCNCGFTEDPTTGLLLVECSTTSCNSTCPVGFSYEAVQGECCGKCVQQQCIYDFGGPSNNIQTIELGKTWTPTNELCVTYNCTKVNNNFVLVKINPSCPVYNPEDCIPGTESTTSDGCCKTCQTENCVLLKKNTFLQVNDCISVQSVEIASCSGSCDTSSVYSVVANTMIQHCSCCQDQRTISKQVEMRCPDNRQITYTYTYVEECGCHVTECKDKKQG